MRRTVITTAIAAFLAGGIATGAILTYAQPAPPPGASSGAPPPRAMADGPGHRPGPGPEGHPWMHWMHWMHHHGGPDGGPGRFAGGPVEGMRAFALVYRQQDRALTPADVQKIAEAFLLWNGNHTWKVANAAALPDGRIGFSLTTPEGSVIAKFAMDPHTARLTRVS